MTAKKVPDLGKTLSDAFKTAFDAYPTRETNPELAAYAARCQAEKLVPKGVAVVFDEHKLTFYVDEAKKP